MREDPSPIISGSLANLFSRISLFLWACIFTRAAFFLTHIAAGTKPALFTCSYTPTNSYTERHVVGLETLLKIWGKTFIGKVTYVCVHYPPLIFLVFYTPGATKSSLCLREDSFLKINFPPKFRKEIWCISCVLA